MDGFVFLAMFCLRLKGDEERLRSLPISPLCDREKHADAPKSQMGFINFVAKPLFDELAAIDIGGLVE